MSSSPPRPQNRGQKGRSQFEDWRTLHLRMQQKLMLCKVHSEIRIKILSLCQCLSLLLNPFLRLALVYL
ncbi:unnamed protein product [Cylicocyclus nassatus]|uniref:Uncharacterized protein n=1 Tax=Cylicocyclus nassatus TaxID=53992 RepID=A0AA36GMV7_CYLNA|nr:unnamed protein product [Cylicocyclus nassatus]